MKLARTTPYGIQLDTIGRLLVPPLVSAALLYAYSSIAGKAALWSTLPLLLAPMAVSWAHTLFFETLVAPYLLIGPLLFVPRPVRFRHSLSRAIVWWRLEREAEDSQMTLRHLGQAIRLASCDEVRRACETLRDDICAGRLGAADAGADALRVYLPRQAPRNPDIGLQILTKRLLGTGALVVTLIFAIVLKAMTPVGTFGAAEFFIACAVCWLAWVLSQFLYEIWYAWKSARSKRSFATVIVSDDNTSAQLYSNASDLYWRVGTVVTVHVRKESDAFYSSWVVDNRENIVAPREKLDAILEVLVTEADLLVALTEDMNIAKQVLDAADLPRDRRLALNSQGTAPTGYAWIEQAALRLDPARPELFRDPRPFLTRYTRRLPGDGAGWEVNSAFATSILLIWVQGSFLLIGILSFIACALLTLRAIAIDRRLRVSRERLRAPRAAEFSAKLDPALLKFRLNLVSFIVSFLALLPVALSYGIREETIVWLVLVLMYVFAIFAPCFILIGMRSFKWWLDKDFRIMILRRNSGTFGYALIEHIMGECGKYGQALLLDHPTVQSYKTGSRDDHMDNTSHWSYFFAEPDLQIQMTDLYPDWQRTYLSELEFADFAMFDWSEKVTEAMAWELHMATLNLPPERILVILNSGVSAKEVLDGLPESHRDQVTCVVLPRDTDDKYTWADHSDFHRGFTSKLSKMMLQLEDKPRVVRVMGIRGAWPLPLACENT